MTPTELVRLRRALGLPDTGPTRDMHRRWSQIEGEPPRTPTRRKKPHRPYRTADPYIDAEVDRLTRVGHSAAYIAERLNISPRTVSRARIRNRQRQQQENNAA